jgi:hypothetical protein
VRGHGDELALEPRGLLQAAHVNLLAVAHLVEALGEESDLVPAADLHRVRVVATLHLLRATH